MEDIMDSSIRGYFVSGYTYLEIQMLLSTEKGIYISYRQLKRHLRRLGLKRRQSWSTYQIQVAMQAELQGTGRNLGCRSMSRRLWTRHGISIGRNAVLQIQHVLDSEGVHARLGHRLSRREYRNKGPNYLVHIDGYDKIKRFGFAIHGAICGYSRRILWLKVAKTNNDPKVVASYFSEFVQEIEGVPCRLRMDAGTENVLVANLQKAFRWYHEDNMCGEKSVIVGSSHTNQRIESWWRQLHQMCIASWQDIFGDLVNQGTFSTAESIHMTCVRFCFMQIIQQELDMVRLEWNTHNIRRQNREGTPHGKPEILYHHPEVFGAIDHKFPVNMEDCTTLNEFCTTPSVTGVEEPVQSRLLELMQRNGRQQPESATEATELLKWLLNHIQ